MIVTVDAKRFPAIRTDLDSDQSHPGRVQSERQTHKGGWAIHGTTPHIVHWITKSASKKKAKQRGWFKCVSLQGCWKFILIFQRLKKQIHVIPRRTGNPAAHIHSFSKNREAHANTALRSWDILQNKAFTPKRIRLHNLDTEGKLTLVYHTGNPVWLLKKSSLNADCRPPFVSIFNIAMHIPNLCM